MPVINEQTLYHEIFDILDGIASAQYRLECALRVFQMVADVMPMDTPDDLEKGLAGAEILLHDATVELRQGVDEATTFWKKLNNVRSGEGAKVH